MAPGEATLASENLPTNRAAGAVLGGAAIFSIFVMVNHPTSAHAGPVGGMVHGMMILLLCLMSWGFANFALALGARRALVLAGIIAYAVSLFGHIGAATINGFVVPALAAREVTDHNLYLLAWESNQALARLGVIATGTAYGLWSIELVRRPGLERWLGLAGLVAGFVPAALLVAGLVRMNVSGAILVYAMHAAWAMLVGAMLWRGGISSVDQPSG
jgi:hypothetical protein